ncbi:PLP-dependent aminotransferase family protein [Tardiphaga sp. OK245]|uniref:aminotransferase-like domain-containing protein n=1 Tax=Tardiphaga sp. OK245 TaxID=1855306 RepID=UPI0008A7F8FD|nr:PLP-dependent aminotransferase family protein [Tardiphaga sp. OK245]SEH88284.1 2-aminoadipate transaminase [Tardiphaga sp. OK245]
MTQTMIEDGQAIGAPAPFASWLTQTNDLTSLFVGASRISGLINIAGGLPAPELLPVEELANLARTLILTHPSDCLGYGPTDGLPELRDAIAERFSSADLRLQRENILITASGTQSLDLIGKVLLESGGNIAAPFPSYVGAMDAWRPRNPRYRDLPLGCGERAVVSALAGCQFAYSVPNFSNPTGELIGVPARENLVAAAHHTGVWLVEDDPYGDLYYDSAPLPRLIDLSAKHLKRGIYDGPVIYLGSFSKMLAPGLRLGWVIAAPDVIRAMSTAKQGTDLCSSGLNQRLALAAMGTGLVDRLRPALLDLYRRRRDALCAAMAAHLSDWFDWKVPVGGMFVWATARDPHLNTDDLVGVARDAGVLVGPSSVFDPLGTDRRSLRLNFTLNSPDLLSQAVRRLADAVRGFQPISREIQ